MKYLERIRVVQFFLYEKEDITLEEITGIFGGNGSGKSSLLDAVQIAMMGGNSNLVALNAQADEKATTRSLRSYCLGQYGENPDQRARDNATTYITLIWRDTETGAPLSMGVCLHASADRDGHEVLGRYILPNIEFAMSDHLEVADGIERPRAWPTFRHQVIERSKIFGEDPLYTDSERYIRAALLALRGSGGAPIPDAFKRAFRFALRMRFDKTVDQIVRDEVLEARPTNIKKFKEITESFRHLAEMVAQVEAKIADGKLVSVEYGKAAEAWRQTITWNALSKIAGALLAEKQLDVARVAREGAESTLKKLEDDKEQLESAFNDAREEAERARSQREAHAAHKDYGALQTAIQSAEGRARTKRTEISNSIQLVRRVLVEALASGLLKTRADEIRQVSEALSHLKEQVTAGTAARQETVASLRPALNTASSAFSEVFEHGIQLKRELAEAKEDVQQAEVSLKRVQAGRAPLSRDVQVLLSELGDHGVQALPVCDLVRISEPEWQPVIEAFLKRNVEALLVPSAQEREAFRIYRGLTGPRAVYGAKIAMESRQTTGKRYESGSVAALIEGDHPAAVAYLQRQFGDLRCASSDKDALDGQRTLTKDGMLVSGGEIERLKLVPATHFRIGSTDPSYRNEVQKELERHQKRVQSLEREEQRLKTHITALQQVGHADSVIKYVTDAWSALDESLHEVASKNEQMKESADEDYIRLGNQERDALERASTADENLKKILPEIGGAQTRLDQCKTNEGAAQSRLDAAQVDAEGASEHSDIDQDYKLHQMDALIDKYEDAFSKMVEHAEDQQRLSRRRMDSATRTGSQELGVFLTKYREHAPQGIADDWRKASEWIASLLKKLNDTELVPFKKDMDDAYRTSQETFRNDVAIALNNNLEWLGETMDRLNQVLRDCPTFSNGERYRFRRVVRPKLEPLLNFVKDVATHGPVDDMFGGPGAMPEEFRSLLDDKVAPGARGIPSPLDDYREFFEFDIEILREDPLTKVPKLIGHLSKRLGPGSGGEHRAPLYVIAGAALASAYKIDRGDKDGLRLMMIDEAFNKMDPVNIIATMRYLEDLGLQIFMASPGENLGILTAFLHRYYDILRDIDNNTIMLEGRPVSDAIRALFREDLPEFNPALIDEEIELIHLERGSSQGSKGGLNI